MTDNVAQYYPALFNRPEEDATEQEVGNVVPQDTLYDMPMRSHHMPCKKYITIFGFSQQNRPNVLAHVRKVACIKKKEEGKNYINVWAEDTADLEKLLKLNHQTIGGEIIGVFRQNFGLVRDSDIYIKKKGLFRILKEYLFGED